MFDDCSRLQEQEREEGCVDVGGKPEAGGKLQGGGPRRQPGRTAADTWRWQTSLSSP